MSATGEHRSAAGALAPGFGGLTRGFIATPAPRVQDNRQNSPLPPVSPFGYLPAAPVGPHGPPAQGGRDEARPRPRHSRRHLPAPRRPAVLLGPLPRNGDGGDAGRPRGRRRGP